MIEWSIDALRACDSVRAIVVATPPGHAHGLDGDDLTVVAGGATRAESVATALDAVEDELVAIHDAARPLLTPELVEGVAACLEAAPEAAGAIAAAPINDTIKQAAVGQPPQGTNPPFPFPGKGKGGLVVEATLDRARLWAAQTPQVFRTAALRAALELESGRDAATDEAMLVEAAGGRVLIHPAPAENFKVTTPHDLRLAELLLAERLSP
jgi:2-C-methyl-D-erythritol 4-phosphate cytidylyltransferase